LNIVFGVAQLVANVPILSEVCALLKGAPAIIIRISIAKQASMAMKRVFLRLQIKQRIVEDERFFISLSPSGFDAIKAINRRCALFIA